MQDLPSVLCSNQGAVQPRWPFHLTGFRVYFFDYDMHVRMHVRHVQPYTRACESHPTVTT